MKWMVIKGVRYPSSVISAFAAYNMEVIIYQFTPSAENCNQLSQ